MHWLKMLCIRICTRSISVSDGAGFRYVVHLKLGLMVFCPPRALAFLSRIEALFQEPS